MSILNNIKGLINSVYLRINENTISPVKFLCILLLTYVYIINFLPGHIIDSVLETSFIGRANGVIFLTIQNSNVAGWITLGVFSLAISFLVHRYYKRNYRYQLAIIFLLFATWIFFDSYWIYPLLGDRLSFRLIFGIILTLCGVLILVMKYFSQKTSSVSIDSEIDNRREHFTTDDSIHFNRESDTYVKNIAVRLKNTHNDNASFAIGIVGNWGCGKTQLLCDLKRELNQELIIDFNPWLAISDETVIKTFFSKLSDIVLKINPNLQSPIVDYVNAILEVEGEQGFVSKVTRFLGILPQNHIEHLKEKIVKSLKNTKTNIYVFVDDMDRLEYQELFEILRLVRNTADFPFVTYIAAYDRNYVESVLRGNGISLPRKYIEKIFNIEIGIPKSIEQTIIQVLNDEVREMEIPLEVLDFEEWRRLPGQYLSNFREVKRFARSFALIYQEMVNNVGEDEFNVRDLFILELLKHVDYDLYVDIKTKVNYTLPYSLQDIGVYVFEIPEAYKRKELAYLDSKRLIRILLNKDKASQSSFVYLNNYYRYFTYQLDNADVSIVQIKEWLDSDDETAAGLIETILNRVGDRNTLLFQLAFVSRENLTARNVGRIIDVLLRYYFNGNKKKEVSFRIMVRTLRVCELSDNEWGSIFEFIDTKFCNIELENIFIIISRMLLSLIENLPNLKNYLQNLMVSNFNRYLVTDNPDASDIVNPHHTLRHLYTNSIEWSTYQDYDKYTGEEYTNKIGNSPLFVPMIQYFKEHKSQLRKYFYESLFCYMDSDSEGNEWLEELPEDMAEDEAKRLFGSFENYEKYYSEAFQS